MKTSRWSPPLAAVLLATALGASPAARAGLVATVPGIGPSTEDWSVPITRAGDLGVQVAGAIALGGVHALETGASRALGGVGAAGEVLGSEAGAVAEELAAAGRGTPSLWALITAVRAQQAGASFAMFEGNFATGKVLQPEALAPVPLPAAVWLLMAGLLGGLGLSVRRRHAPPPCVERAAVVVVAATLAACGGGGGSESTASEAEVPPPSSGHYAWVLRAEGPTDAVRYGLSLIHPEQRDIEIVIESPSESVTDAKLVTRASVDAATLSTGALEPHALLYVRGGDVRRVPLAANGQPPAARVQRAQTSSACRFVLDAPDHAAPEQSRFVVATAGADGRCDSADDARAEVRLDPVLGPVLSPWSGSAPLAALRDPATLAPRGWLTGTEMRLWSPAGGAPEVVTVRAATDPLQRAVLATHRAVLVEAASGMSVLEFSGGNDFTETGVPGLAGRGWQAIGFDATHYYLHRNASSATVESWSIARVHRGTLAVTSLASGAGRLVLTGLGRDVLYATVATAGTLELRRLAKAVAGAADVLASGPLADSFFAVLTGSEGAHMVWRVTGLAGDDPAQRVDIVDEAGLVLRSGGPGGFSLGLAEASRIDFSRSENRTRFLFAEGYGARLFGDATLHAYDSVARQAVAVGRLPGQAAMGTDPVFANVLAGPMPGGAGFAARTVGGVVQADGARVFSFDPAVADSLFTATRQR